MLKLVPFLVLLCLFCNVPNAKSKYSDLKLSLDFHQIDLLKTNALRPLIELYLQNFTIPGPFALNLPLMNSTVIFQLSNLNLASFTLNWDKTVFDPVDVTHISLTLFDFEALLETDYDINFSQIDLQGRANLTITNLTMLLELNFQNNSIDSGFTMGISNFSLNYDSINLDVNSKIVNWLSYQVFKVFKCVVIEQISQLILGDINNQIMALTSQMIQIPITNSPQGDTYLLNVSMVSAPFVAYFQNDTNSFSYLTLNIDVQAFNNRTGATAVLHELDYLPVRSIYTSDIRAYVCNSMLIQLQWLIIDSGILNITLDGSMVPESSPVKLNTSSIMLIVPGMTAKYGANKGIYVRATAASTYSQIVFRGGRLVGEVSLVLDFFVDQNSTNYPLEGLNNCMDCEKALSIKTTLLLALHADTNNDTTIYANIINLDFYYMTVLEQTIDFEESSFEVLIKDVAKSFIPILNAGLKNINNPFVGMFGVTQMNFRFSNDYIFLGLEFAENNEVQTISY